MKFINQLFAVKSNPSNDRSLSSRTVQTSNDDSQMGNTRQLLIKVTLRDLLRRYGMGQNWIECHTNQAAGQNQSNSLYLKLLLKHWDERLLRYLPALQNELFEDLQRLEPTVSQWLGAISWELLPVEDCPYKVLPSKNFWLQAAPAATTEMQEQISTSRRYLANRVALAVPPLMPLRDALPADAESDLMQLDPSGLREKISITESEMDMHDLEMLFEIRDAALSNVNSSTNSASHNRLNGPNDSQQNPTGYEKTQPARL